MKYAIFFISALGVPPLAVLLSLNKRWMKYAFIGVLAAMCLYTATSINFFSHETYRGSARGMEVSLAHLMAFVLIGALLISRRFKKWIPDAGYVIYILYFLLCLPSLSSCENLLYGWFEIWKMIMLYFFYIAVYNYLKATDDMKTVVGGLAAFSIVNMATTAIQHVTGSYQPHGIFPHQNGMAVAMHLFGTLFFAAYLMRGVRTRFAKLCTAAFLCAGAATVRSFSRMAIALIPVGYSIVLLCCVAKGRARGWARRIVPIAILGAIGTAAILPRVIERYVTAPEASGTTRVEFARCAWEMIKDEPWRGVGINNWGIKINAPYEYAELAERNTGQGEDYEDGIVETVYLLVCAECGIPAFLALVVWFGYYWWKCVSLMKRLKGTRWFFVPAGLIGGFTAAYLQSCMEWVFRQQLNLICLMFMYAMLSYLDSEWRKLRDDENRQSAVIAAK